MRCNIEVEDLASGFCCKKRAVCGQDWKTSWHHSLHLFLRWCHPM